MLEGENLSYENRRFNLLVIQPGVDPQSLRGTTKSYCIVIYYIPNIVSVMQKALEFGSIIPCTYHNHLIAILRH